MKLSSIKAIAEEANVSTATVSRVFSGKDYVSEKTRTLVLKIAEEHGYIPKKYKKATTKNVYRSTIVVMLPEIDNSFYCEILTGIQKILDKYEVDILICSSNNSPGRELHLLSLFEQLQISGLIVVPTSGTTPENIALFKKMRKNIPIVMLDRSLPGLDFDGVFMDNYDASCKATELLISNGHTNIAFVSGSDTSTARLRLEGFTDTIKKHNIHLNEDYILPGNFDADTSYQLTKNFIKQQKIQHDGKLEVTAFFTASSKMMSGCLLAIVECGFSVPEDIAILTFGETFLVRNNISYIKYPSMAMGEECAKILLEKLSYPQNRKNSPSRNIIYNTEIVLAGSERFPNKNDE